MEKITWKVVQALGSSVFLYLVGLFGVFFVTSGKDGSLLVPYLEEVSPDHLIFILWGIGLMGVWLAIFCEELKLQRLRILFIAIALVPAYPLLLLIFIWIVVMLLYTFGLAPYLLQLIQ